MHVNLHSCLIPVTRQIDADYIKRYDQYCANDELLKPNPNLYTPEQAHSDIINDPRDSKDPHAVFFERLGLFYTDTTSQFVVKALLKDITSDNSYWMQVLHNATTPPLNIKNLRFVDSFTRIVEEWINWEEVTAYSEFRELYKNIIIGANIISRILSIQINSYTYMNSLEQLDEVLKQIPLDFYEAKSIKMHLSAMLFLHFTEIETPRNSNTRKKASKKSEATSSQNITSRMPIYNSGSRRINGIDLSYQTEFYDWILALARAKFELNSSVPANDLNKLLGEKFARDFMNEAVAEELYNPTMYDLVYRAELIWAMQKLGISSHERVRVFHRIVQNFFSSQSGANVYYGKYLSQTEMVDVLIASEQRIVNQITEKLVSSSSSNIRRN